MKKILILLLIIETLLFPNILFASKNIEIVNTITFSRVGGSVNDPVEQESPDWQYASNAYNIWRCTHYGTEQDMLDGTGTDHPDNCVHNKTGCIWDVDDGVEAVGGATLVTGQALQGSECVITDSYDNFGGDNKLTIFSASAPNKSITVIASDSSGRSWTLQPIANKNSFRWYLCIGEPPNQVYGPIENSNGGTGNKVIYTLTITALKKIQNVSAGITVWGWLKPSGEVQQTC